MVQKGWMIIIFTGLTKKFMDKSIIKVYKKLYLLSLEYLNLSLIFFISCFERC